MKEYHKPGFEIVQLTMEEHFACNGSQHHCGGGYLGGAGGLGGFGGLGGLGGLGGGGLSADDIANLLRNLLKHWL